MMKPAQRLKMEMIFLKALSAKQINDGNSNRSKTFEKLKQKGQLNANGFRRKK